MTMGIYCIEHVDSGKKYVGKSVNIENRLSTHKSKLLNKNPKQIHNSYLYNYVQKYGWLSFKCYTLEVVEDINKLSERELWWMKSLETLDRNKGFNLIFNSDSCSYVSDETRNKISKKLKGVPKSIEHVNKLKGRKGEKRSELSKLKMSLSAIGKVISEDTKNKMSNSRSKFVFLQITHNNEIIRIWRSTKEIKESGLFDPSAVRKVCVGILKQHKGFLWERVAKNAALEIEETC